MTTEYPVAREQDPTVTQTDVTPRHNNMAATDFCRKLVLSGVAADWAFVVSYLVYPGL
jgi:hypothetical protein